MYGFMIGVCGTLIANHIMIYWNRKAKEADDDLEDMIAGTLVKDIKTGRIALMKHKFAITDVYGANYRLSVAWRVGTLAALGLSIILIIIGSALPLISFKFKGVFNLKRKSKDYT